jgi:hypothetical protein
MNSLFEGDRRAHDRARAEKAKVGASACAVATGLLGCRVIDGMPHSVSAKVGCPFTDCASAPRSDAHMKASKEGPNFACACGLRKGDTVQMVREVLGLNFGQSVDRLTQFLECGGQSDPASRDLFGGIGHDGL